MPRASRQRLGACALAAVLLHVGAGAALVRLGVAPPVQEQPPVTVEVVMEPDPVAEPEPDPTPAPDPAPTPAPNPAPTPAPDPAPTPAPDPAPTPAPDPAPIEAEPPPPEPVAADPPPAPAEPAAEIAAPPPPVRSVERAKPTTPRKPVPRPAVKPDTVTQPAKAIAPAPTEEASPPTPPPSAAEVGWQGKVHAWLRRFRRYPPDALRRGDEGVVLMRLTIARDGRVVSSQIVRGSGSPDLDTAAGEWIARAGTLPAFPAEMTAPRIDMLVPLTFTIQ